MSSTAVIIPAYNEASAIGKVLEALPNSVDKVVVVDNGSTDETGAIADHYSGQDSRIIVIHKEILDICYTFIKAH